MRNALRFAKTGLWKFGGRCGLTPPERQAEASCKALRSFSSSEQGAALRAWAGVAVGAALVAVLLAGCSSSEPPAQPIAFRHKVHVADNKIDCVYCHVYAAKSTVAGVPSVMRCMGCHRVLAKEKAEVQKIRASWERKKPIPWIKIHNLPDHVYFSHKAHVRQGITCQRCHGPVGAMERVRQVSSLEMGWCVSCHKKNKASVDCLVCHK